MYQARHKRIDTLKQGAIEPFKNKHHQNHRLRTVSSKTIWGGG